jgi:HK97 family phage major capsid protein
MKKSMFILKATLALLALVLVCAAIGMPGIFGAAGIAMAFPLILGSIQTSDDAKVERGKILDQMDELIQLRKTEKRSFTDAEQQKYNELKADCDNLTKHIDQLMDEEKRAFMRAEREANKKNPAKRTPAEKEQEEIRKYSFANVIKAGMKEKPLDGIEEEMAQEARSIASKSGINLGTYAVPDMVFRAMSATGQTTTAGDQGGTLIPTEKSGLIEALEPRMVLSSLGAQTMGNIIGGNFELPTIGAVTSLWEGENDEAADGSPGTGQKKLTPHRLSTVALYSRQLEFQSNYNIEQVLRNLILRSIAGKVEKTAINGGGTDEPKGLLSTTGIATVAGGTNGAAPTYANIVALETAIAALDADLGSLGYLTNSKVRGKLKTTLKDANVSGHIWEPNNEINGYKTGITNHVPSNLVKGTSGTTCSAILFGNFMDLLMANWAGVDMIFDEVTVAHKAQKRLVANTWWDFAVLRAESFAKMVDALTV